LFIKTNKLCKEKSTQKSKERFPLLSDRLNYNQLLIKQQLIKRFLVIYSGTGTNISSCVIDRKNLVFTNPNNPIEFIADVKTWIYETDNELEAHYLCSLLNSPHLNGLIKPLQPQGLGGARAIHRRPFQFKIPKFNEKDKKHIKLAKLSIESHKIIRSANLPCSLKSRKISRNLLQSQIELINSSSILILNQDN
jgi:hypothetical protein